MPPSLHSVRVRLLGLVLLAGVPTLGLVLYSGLEQRHRAEERSLEQARHLTELASLNIDDALHDAQVLLQSLAQMPEVRRGDAAACEKLFHEVVVRESGNLPRSLHPFHRGNARPGQSGAGTAGAAQAPLPYSAIALADLEGQLVASSIPVPGRVNIRDRANFQLALATHTIAISAYPKGHLTQQPGVAVAYRVLGMDGRVRGVLVVTVEVGWLNAAVAGGLLPPGGTLLVLDSRGTVLTRFPDSGQYVGQAYPDVPVVHEVLARKEGEIEAASIDGVTRLWSFRPVAVAPGSDIFVALGFSPKAIFAEADRVTQRQALVLVLLLGSMTLALWLWANRFILRPVDALMRVTRRLQTGQLSARTDLTETSELGELGRSFDEMAEELQSREQELRASKLTLEAVLASSPIAILTLNREGRVTLWTPAAERLFGWSAGEVRSREVPFATPGQAPEAGGLGARLRTGEPFMDEEWTGVHRDGRRLDLSVSSLPLTRADGTVTGQVVAVADLTARRQLERQLQQSQQMEAIGRLAGGVAHDFNNLLTVIQGLSEAVLDRAQLDADSRHDLDGVRQATLRGSELSAQLLAFGRRQRAEPRVVDLNEQVQGMAGMLRRLIGEDIQLETRLQATPSRIKADPGQIGQAITYLLVNARDAMPRGGKLVIETANASCAEALGRRCKAGCPGSCVTLAVSDTGTGMDADTLEHVFEPFFAAGERLPGNGLGLAAVYGIVQQCGGDIEVTSEPGRGSTFRIFLPAASGAVATAAAPSGARHATGSSGAVLLVEDDEDVREVSRSALERAGYHVLEARDGQEALEVAQRHPGPIALLLTDVVMPEMGGPELAGRLQQVLPALPVLYFSGYAPGSGGGLGVPAGAPFLPKPFRPAVLVGKVREILTGE
jgi:PAS domain S-box-containing protein